MFGRVAAWGFAAFLVVALAVVLPAHPGDPTGPFAQSDRPASADPDQMANRQTIPPHNQPEKAADPAPIEARAEPQAHGQATGQAPGPDDAQSPESAKLTLDTARPGIAPPPAAEPFGLATTSVSFGNVWTKWRGVEADIRSDNEVLARCRDDAENCPAAAQSFLAIVAQGRAQTGRSRIGVINRAINLAIEPMSDLAQWGVPDRWSSPLETFTTGRGDCEDYAIAKYVALTAAGFAPEDVKLVIVQNTALEEDHAVVTVHLDGAWIVLDNRWLTLVADSEMQQAIPRFVLDGDGVRQFARPDLVASRRVPAPASF